MHEDNKLIIIIMCGFFGFVIFMGGLGMLNNYLETHRPPTQCRIDGVVK